MAKNNEVKLTGNIGHEIEVKQNELGKEFAFVSVATKDSYKDENEEYRNLETIWHKVAVFNPQVLARIKDLKKGTRVTITGSLNYQPFKTILEDGREVTKKEATIFASYVEQAPLVAKP